MKVPSKGPATILQKNQYPLNPVAKAGLKPRIDKFLKCGILKPCQSSYNSPILRVKKPNGKYQMVQDLRAINEAVEPIHPIMPTPYPVLAQGPGDASWFSVLD